MSTVSLSHRDFGGAHRPPLVILHGLLGSSRNWQTAGRDLSSAYHVYALDLRNQGASPHSGEMTYPAMTGDVVAWLDAHRLERVTLLGHSLGGKVAMLMACLHPARVQRLVVIDIAPRSYHSHAHRAEFAAMNELEVATVASRSEAELRFESRVSDWTMRKFLATNLERDDRGSWRWAINLPVLTEALPHLERNPLAADDRFAGDTQFIVGGRSRYVTTADHPAIQHHFPTARIDIIPEAGHNPHMEAREKLVACVLSGAAAPDTA